MPSYHEVRLYLIGLFLLIKGDRQGFRMLDISDRGMMRSFWAFVWCLPAMAVSWLWWRSLFLNGMPRDTKVGGIFFVRLAMLEVMDWILPLIFVGLVCALLGIGKKFPALVITFNWLSIPFAYAYGVLSIGFLLHIGIDGLLAIVHLCLLILMVVCVIRITRLICGPQPLIVTTLVMVLIVPDMLLSEAMQRFLEVYPT